MGVEVNLFRQLSIVFFILSVLSLSRSETIRRVVTAGDNVTLDCYPPRSSINYVLWIYIENNNPENIVYVRLRSGYVQNFDGFPEHKYSVGFVKDWDDQKSSFRLTIINSSKEESGGYRCYENDPYAVHDLSEYYIAVIQCTCSSIDSIQDGIQEHNASCDVNGYSEYESRLSLKINITTIEGMTEKDGILEIGKLNFAISTIELQYLKRITFNPFPDYQSHVSCYLPDRLPTTSRTTPITTTLGDMTQASTHFSTTSMLVTSKPKSNKNRIIIIAAVIGIMLFILISIIFFFIRHLKKRRTSNDRSERREDEQKDAVKGEGVYFALIKDSIETSNHVYATSTTKTKTHNQESIGPHSYYENEQENAVKGQDVYYASIEDSVEISHVYATSVGKTKTHSQESIGPHSHYENEQVDAVKDEGVFYASIQDRQIN